MNFTVPQPGSGLLFGGNPEKAELAKIVSLLAPMGYKLYAVSKEIKKHLEQSAEGIKVDLIEFPKTDKRKLREVFQKYDISGVFNLANDRAKTLLDEDYVMRRNAVDFNVPLFMEPKVCHIPTPILKQY